MVKKVVLVLCLSGFVIVFLLFNNFSLSLDLVASLVGLDIPLSCGVDQIILGRGSDITSLLPKNNTKAFKHIIPLIPYPADTRIT